MAEYSHNSAWFNGKKQTEISLIVNTPNAAPRKTEGLLDKRDLLKQKNLLVAWDRRDQFDQTPIGQKVRNYFKGGQLFDYDDLPEHPVLSDRPEDTPDTAYYVPIAGGRGSVWYAAVQFHPDSSVSAQDMLDQQQAQARKGPPTWELTVSADGTSTFTSKTDQESMAKEGPHPGRSIVGRGIFEQVAGGRTPQDLGLPKRLVAWQPDGTIKPAVVEYTSLVTAAQQGDPLALATLQSLGLTPPGAAAPMPPANSLGVCACKKVA